MQKMPTMYERDETKRGGPVTPVLKAECLWVEQGEGIATRKLDGMNVKVEAGVLYKRQKPESGVYDEAAYVPARWDDPADRYLFEAFDAAPSWEDGIYEVLGPRTARIPRRPGHRGDCVSAPGWPQGEDQEVRLRPEAVAVGAVLSNGA